MSASSGRLRPHSQILVTKLLLYFNTEGVTVLSKASVRHLELNGADLGGAQEVGLVNQEALI